MSGPPKHRIVAALLDRHGTTYAAAAGIRLRDTPAPLFQLLCLSLLLSARISADIAIEAAKALRDQSWTTPEKLAASSWAERTRVLNESGYARYDESTSRMLDQTTTLLLDRYGGDLRRLRDDADHDADDERRLLQEFTGIGKVGASIFSREVQLVWDEMYPYADDRALEAADELGLGTDTSALVRNTDGVEHFTRVVAALVRCRLAGDESDILEAARS